jgi:hypothetical protein
MPIIDALLSLLVYAGMQEKARPGGQRNAPEGAFHFLGWFERENSVGVTCL